MEKLEVEFIKKDVEDALISMHPTKSLGPDGMPALFYQNYWGLIGDRISKACFKILNNGDSVEEWNKTIIALVPKVEKARAK